MKNIVLSGINLFEGGALSIYYDCMDEIIGSNYLDEFIITAFVSSKDLFKKYESLSKVKIIELPLSRKNYLYRLYYELYYFRKYSKNKNIDIWISLHDITPRVYAKRIYTYCQLHLLQKMFIEKICIKQKIFMMTGI